MAATPNGATEAAIAILRVSTGDQDETSQWPDIEAFAEANGLHIVHKELVHGKSAFHGKHLQQVHDAVDVWTKTGVTAVIFWKLDRGTRQGLDGAVNLRQFVRSRGARMLFATQAYLNGTDTASEMMFANLAIMAQEGSKTKSDRIKATHNSIHKNGGFVGKAPFGYQTEGEKYHKRLTPDPVKAPLAREVFQRVADGRTALSVAQWLSGVLGKTVRPKFVIDMIGRELYWTGKRDTAVFEPLVTETLWNQANAALATRSFSQKGGRAIVHSFSGLIFCECEAPLYRHQSSKNGKPVGAAKYRCSRGRRSNPTETTCGREGLPVDAVDAAVEAFMLEDITPEYVMVTTGGDHGRQKEIQALEAEVKAAMSAGDYGMLAVLGEKLEALKSAPVEPVVTKHRRTGKTVADVWRVSTMTEKRALLKSRYPSLYLEVSGEGEGIHVNMQGDMA